MKFFSLIVFSMFATVAMASGASSSAINVNLSTNQGLYVEKISAKPFSPQASAKGEGIELNNSAVENFLPVDEAYQLSLQRKASGLAIDWVIADNYFLYGEQFRFSANGKALKAQIPSGKIAYDPIFEKDVEKHYRYVRAIIAEENLPSQPGFELAVTSQGCADAGLCYPPQTRYFLVDAEGISAIADVAKSSSLVDGRGDSETVFGNATVSSPLTIAGMLLLALTGGIILNLMPCVLPVLSLKALSIVSSQEDHRLQGWSYTLGVILAFTLAAVVLLSMREAGQAVGWGFQLQSPGFVTLLIFLFFVIGLSLSGYITIGGQWMGVGQSLTQGSGLKPCFFTGVLAAAVASPCTAPFMATALGFAITQSWWIALGVFVALGLGMALPLLLLSYLPQLQKVLPKPGPWMETFKQALAFPLYLTALWLLWVLGRQLGSDAVMVVVSGCLLILFTFWLSKYLTAVQRFVAIGNLVIVAAFMAYISQFPTQPPAAPDSESVWENYSERRLSALRQQGKPVFINLTADWCITCQWNEKLVFTDDAVSYTKSKGIYLVKGDWTSYQPNITRLLEKYGRGGVPLYLLFPAQVEGEPMILPQILTPNAFRKAIDSI